MGQAVWDKLTWNFLEELHTISDILMKTSEISSIIDFAENKSRKRNLT